MTRKLLVRQGGGSADEIDYANDYAARKGSPFFDEDSTTSLVQVGQRFANGESAQGFFKLVDPNAEESEDGFRLRPHAEVKLTEDASGDELILGWMRVTGGSAGRNGTTIPGDEIEHDPQLFDCNWDIRGLPFQTMWERPAETDWERLQALQLVKLNGSASTGAIFRETTDITVDRFSNGHLVEVSTQTDLEAVTYPRGTFVEQIISDIAEQAGKSWSVVLHHDGGSTHKCLAYFDQDDLSTWTTAVKISDDPADWDPDDPSAPVFEPHWLQGAGRESEKSQVISGLISIYGGTDDDPNAVYVETGEAPEDWETFVDVFFDDQAKGEVQAERRANWHLADRKRPWVTNQVSILVSADQAHLVTAGQAIQTKSAVLNSGGDLGTYVWRRVAECTVEPVYDGRYWLHLKLERPRLSHGASHGGGQPGATSPKPRPPCTPTDPGGIGDAVALSDALCEAGEGVLESVCGVDRCHYGSAGGFTGWNTVAVGTYWTEITAGFKYNWFAPGEYKVEVRDTAAVLPTLTTSLWTGLLPHGMYSPGSGDCFDTVGGVFEVPAGYDEVRFILSARGTGYEVLEGSHALYEYTPPSESTEDDPDCVPAGEDGDSPFFARSDDPRFDADDQHLTSKIQERVTNNSGGTLAAGDVVIADITYDGHGVTTTTTAETTAARIGIIVEGGDDGEGVVVLWEGVYGGAINIGADTAADGDYLFTSTTAGAASTDATRTTGAFARVIRDEAGDTEYTLIWGVPDSGTSSSSGGGGTLDNWLALHRFLVTANRGYNIADDSNGGTSEPENTMEGFRLSAQVGADGVEADIQQNADGSWVVMHDTTVNRTTTSTGNVNAKTDAQWAALVIDGGQGYNSTRHGSSYSPPFLTDVIDACSAYQVFFMLEVKGGDMGELATFLDDQGIIERTLVVASLTNANSIKAANPAIACMVNYPEGEDEASVDWLSGEYTEWTSLSLVNGVLPQVPHAYIDIADITTDESSVLQDMYDRGVRSFESYMISEAVDFRDSAAAGEPTADAHIADTTDAHDASAISIADAGSYYTGTDVEAALQEIGADLATPSSGGGDHDHIVDEQFSGDGSTTTFDLANSAEPESAIAYVAGTRTTVTVGGTLNDQITFAVAPASGTNNISVDYVAPIS